MKNVLLLCATLSVILSYGQTPISGVVNTYIDVTGIDAVNSTVDVSSSAGFASGDRVLLIQMKGAVIDETDSPTFGEIASYNDAGNYEFHTICNVSGTTIQFNHEIIQNYTPSEVVQLVKVPQYDDAIISGGDITATPWDGTIGGIVVIECTGNLDFGSQNIDVSGQGFMGAAAVNSGAGCSGLFIDNSYYSPFSDPDTKALKGEGIALPIVGKETGRGPLANGGGGGNNHNAGGAGGANYGFGGAGGRRIQSSAFTCGSVIGVESISLSAGYGVDKIFLGGGGGAGHGNNAGFQAESGTNGGGIVIIKAASISGNGQSILADGLSHPDNSQSEGGGGAGAGGTILLDVQSITTPLNATANGGNGTDTDNAGSSNCNGPGGGGGGGIVWTSGASTPAGLSTSTTGGTAGVIATTSQSGCVVGDSNGATDGQAGTTINDLVLVEGTTIASVGSTSESACFSYTVPSGDETYTTSGSISDTLTNMFGCDSIVIIDLTILTVDTSVTPTISMLSANAVGASYQWIDCSDSSAVSGATAQDFSPSASGDYAVIVDDGTCVDTSSCYSFTFGAGIQEIENQFHIYPNPFENEIYIDLAQPAKVTINDCLGKVVTTEQDLNPSLNKIDLNDLAPGIYYVILEQGNTIQSVRLVKQ